MTTALPAIVSVGAAVMAWFSARQASRQASTITALNHTVAALDRQAEQIWQDYRELFKALGGFGADGDSVKSIMAAGEILRANVLTDDTWSDHIKDLTYRYALHLPTETAKLKEVLQSQQTKDLIHEVREGFRDTLRRMAAQREEAIEMAQRGKMIGRFTNTNTPSGVFLPRE